MNALWKRGVWGIALFFPIMLGAALIHCSDDNGGADVPCVTDADCPQDFWCDTTVWECRCSAWRCAGKCCGDDGCGGTCPDDCPAGTGCDPDTCLCGDEGCSSDEDCAEGEKCWNKVCIGEEAGSWRPTALLNAPSARGGTVVWTGSKMIVWGGGDSDSFFNDGGIYDPQTDTWTPISTVNAPEARVSHTAVWTGSEMIVWGGLIDKSSTRPTNTGGIYDPQTDTWSPMTTIFAPEVRQYHTAVWTGSRMIVWGGAGVNSTLITGGIYDPQADAWAPTSTVGAPELYYWHTAVWTGAEMIVWGGLDQLTMEEINAGGIYDFQADSWRPTTTVNAPLGRFAHTAVWTGSRMIIWGGLDETSTVTNTGGVYDPSADSWAATPTVPPYQGRQWHSAVWTGAEMIVWGGSGWWLNTGDIYDPQSDSWILMSTTGAPQGRGHHSAVWTGSEMIVWGGAVGREESTNTGGVYTPP